MLCVLILFRAWDKAKEKFGCPPPEGTGCDCDLLGIREAIPFQYNPHSPPYLDIIGYAFIALGGIIALASLLCICLVFESWER